MSTLIENSEAPMASDVNGWVWPDGCPKKSACARHSACMYGCATHKDRPPGDVASEINAETERRKGVKIDPADRLSHMAREIAADSFLVEAIARWTKQVIAEVVAYEKEKHDEAASALISERDARVKAQDQAHFANGTAELALKHRDAAEAKLAEAVKVIEQWEAFYPPGINPYLDDARRMSLTFLASLKELSHG